MASGSYAPDTDLKVTDANNLLVSGGLVWTYLAGTTTPVATYTDVGLLVANTNPIVANSQGRFTAFLSPGGSYKFVYETAAVPPAHGTVIITRDNIASVPGSASNLDITGTAGEALTAGQPVYLSDGSGGKNAGQWYRADNTLAYASLAPPIGMVPAAILSGAAGTIRLSGQMTGIAVAVGSDYYIGTVGTITATAPAQARKIGRADSVSTLIIGIPTVVVQNWTNDFRITLTPATPITVLDVMAATTIYCSPLTGNRIDLPDSNGNPVRVVSAEFSVAVPATTSQMYDIFAYNNAGLAALELLAWTNDTTRATAIIRTTTGRYYKTGDLTRMYVGSFRTTTVSGQTESSLTKLYVWNYYNRVDRLLRVVEATATWAYSTAAYRQANGSTANQVDVVVGVAEVAIDLIARHYSFQNSSAGVNWTAIGEDGTTPTVPQIIIRGASTGTAEAGPIARLVKYPAVGRHYYTWLERSNADGNPTTWYGNNGDNTLMQTGLDGKIQG